MSKGVLSDAHNFSINNSHIIDQSHTVNTVNNHITSQTINSSRKSGLEILLDASIPGALHDSFARYPPPCCHPGTRKEHISKITDWALHGIDRVGRILWLHGPAGVGKSAVAQSCAEALKDKLGASFFFSAPNSRDNPNQFFTTISYQLATRNKLCRQIVDAMVHDNPALVTKSIRQQFEDLIIAPLRELKARGEELEELAIVIDGLDECDTIEAQCDIVDIIANSVRTQSTPFIWIFASRPESHLVTSFESKDVLPISFHLELPISRAIDGEIMLFLTDELEKIRQRNDLPPSWISEQDIWIIVDLSAGLFIYAATVVRFIGEQDSSSPEDQLRAVLALAVYSKNTSSINPLSKLDTFYTLIMQRLPSKILPTIQKILLATKFNLGVGAVAIANLLDLSESQFRSACRHLYSVLRLDGKPLRIHFYHASFMEFLCDPARSGKFCITSECAVVLRRELSEKLNKVHNRRTASFPINMPLAWPSGDIRLYELLLRGFFILCQSIPLDPQMIAALTEFNYALIPMLWHGSSGIARFTEAEFEIFKFSQNIPAKFRHKIIRRYPKILFRHNLLEKPRGAVWDRPYILGRGNNKVLCWRDVFDGAIIVPYPSPWKVLTRTTGPSQA